MELVLYDRFMGFFLFKNAYSCMQVCKLIWMEDQGAIAPYSFLHVINLQFTGHKSLH